MIHKLRGAGLAEYAEMSIAAGGLIKQTIVKDDRPTSDWDTTRATLFNVTLVNAQHFNNLTDLNQPPTPVTAKVYLMLGLP